MGDDNHELDSEISNLLNKISKASKKIEHENGNISDDFEEYVSKGCEHTLRGGRFVSGTCDSCGKKRAINRAWKKVCNIKYIPPYVDDDCRDFKLALIIEKIEPKIIEKVFKFLIYRVTINEIVCCIDDPEWKVQAESILRANGYYNFIRDEFGSFNKEETSQLLFDVNFCYFDYQNKRTLTDSECVTMLKYYIVYALRDKIKESIVKIAELIELDLEYKIAVIEGEIRYIIKCLLEQLLITPFEGQNLTVTSFNKIGSLTELLEIFNGLNSGKHDQRNDFKHIRDTINKYEKVLRTSFDFLNRKIKELECLVNQRRFIVGVTGICDRGQFEEDTPDILIPPQPVIILNPRDGSNY